MCEDQAYIDACSRRKRPHTRAHEGWAEAGAKPVIESGMKHPSGDSCSHCGKHDVNVRAVYRVQSTKGFLRPQVENAVSAKGSCGAIVQIEKSDGTVSDGTVEDGKSHRQQRVHRAHRQPVERELQGLVGGLADFPPDVRRHQGSQHDRKGPPLAYKIAKQLNPLTMLRYRPNARGAT